MVKKLVTDLLLMIGYVTIVLSPTFFIDEEYITAIVLATLGVISFIISYKLIRQTESLNKKSG